MNDIVITEFLEPAAIEVLKKDFKVHWDRELWTKRADLEKLVRTVPGLIVRNRTPVDAALLELAPKLKVVGRLGVGLDNIDVAECERRGIEGVLGARPHRLVAGEWPREELGRGVELAGRRLGIVGLGSIGSTTARKARALEMRVAATDPYLPDGHEHWNIAEKLTLEELLETCDVITIHCPLTRKRAA
jgi:(S)-sulfolactate dehydrogenase